MRKSLTLRPSLVCIQRLCSRWHGNAWRAAVIGRFQVSVPITNVCFLCGFPSQASFCSEGSSVLPEPRLGGDGSRRCQKGSNEAVAPPQAQPEAPSRVCCPDTLLSPSPAEALKAVVRAEPARWRVSPTRSRFHFPAHSYANEGQGMRGFSRSM